MPIDPENRNIRIGENIAKERISEWSRYRAMFERGEIPAFSPSLRLNGLGLRRIPASLRHLRNLQVLVLELNAIETVPRWIAELNSLVGLNLDNNQLSELPAEIGTLPNLKALWLKNNKLTSLPNSFRDLSLRELHLTGNPDLGIPESVLRTSPQEILRYYFESREDGRPLLELKLLLVGRGKAGKTTLVKRLAGETADPHESETHSIDIRELNIDCSEETVRARAWDFGGQEILHATHQFFLTERALYLVVLEPRTGLAQRDAEYWLKLIETQGAGAPVIVVLNWSHGRPWRIDEVRLRRKFPFIVDFVSTDALHGDGIDDLRLKVVTAVEERVPDVWLPFPIRWRSIKDAVASMKKNFLTYREYTALCDRLGEKRPDAQADLAGILNALGLALYFGKDPRLHDTRVLNPGWVTGGVYAVIRAPSVAANDGQLAVSDMPRVLLEAEQHGTINSSDYPVETHAFILELMHGFQLCYASEESKGKPTRYLVPDLLPEFEPAMSERWEKAPTRLRYRYEVLSPGLLSRFIVRTHALSEGAPHWRHGVVLSHAGARALIRDESDKPELHVFVLDGDEETRRMLVAIVRRELETLHAEMKVQPTEELELTGEGDQWISVKALRDVEENEKPSQRLPVQPEGTATVFVSNELDKLLPADVRSIDREPSTAPAPVRLFVSYAHNDERQLKRLDCILDVLEQQHGLSPWRDKRLIAGDDWNTHILERLEQMDIFLFIASQASLVSKYIVNIELQRAIQRRRDIEIVTVKLEPCAADDDKFLGKLQRLASRFKSIAEAPLKSTAWEEVRKDLLPVIQRVREKKAKSTR